MMPVDNFKYQIIKDLDPEYIEALIERFWQKVERQAGDGCWEWVGCKNSRGYGCVGVNGKVQLTHRVSHELFIGPIPDGYFVCHHCDKPCCVRPDHLFAGTNSDNMRDAIEKGRYSVQTKLDDWSVVFWRNNFDPQQHSTTDIAELLGVSQPTVASFLTGETYAELPGTRHQRLTSYFIPDEEKQKAITLYRAGVAAAEIIPQVQMSQASFYRIVNEAA